MLLYCTARSSQNRDSIVHKIIWGLNYVASLILKVVKGCMMEHCGIQTGYTRVRVREYRLLQRHGAGLWVMQTE